MVMPHPVDCSVFKEPTKLSYRMWTAHLPVFLCEIWNMFPWPVRPVVTRRGQLRVSCKHMLYPNSQRQGQKQTSKVEKKDKEQEENSDNTCINTSLWITPTGLRGCTRRSRLSWLMFCVATACCCLSVETAMRNLPYPLPI